MPPKGKKKEANLCKDVPSGEVLTDLRKGQWVTGKSIGSGGFGFIYLAQKKSSEEATKASDKSTHVVKIEPHGNGPLFCETAFYQRAAKKEKIEEWRKSRKLKYHPVPHYIASGLHKIGTDNLRFLVMPKFGADLHKLWTGAGNRFRRDTVAKVAVSLLNALEYIHASEYVHADIKGANILCGASDPSQVYLVDFGLAFRYVDGGRHKTGKPDPRKAHNGTIEYTSTDAHNGSNPSRRGDVEILGYCLLHWLSGSLPWQKHLARPEQVKEGKRKMLDDVRGQVAQLMPDDDTEQPEEIVEVLEHASQLGYEDEPDYAKLHRAFELQLKKMNTSAHSPIDWSSPCDQQQQNHQKQKAPAVSRQQRAKAKKQQQQEPLASKTNELTATASAAAPKPSASKQTAPKRKVAGRRKKVVEVSSSSSSESEQEDNKEEVEMKSPAPKRKPPARRAAAAAAAKSDSDGSMTSPGRHQQQLRHRASFLMTSDTDDYQTPPQQRIRAKGRTAAQAVATRSSRHSMAPLHTDPGLAEGDKLIGEKVGKHQSILRPRRRNVVKSDAVTQTTPSLKKNRKKRS